MILADKIIDLRKKNGWSQEELADKLNVSRQAVSKWESAQSMPDLQRILQMAQLFGVTTDYLLKDDMEAEEKAEQSESDTSLRRVTIQEANEFIATQEKASGRIALGVLLCILSPICLICLAGVSSVSPAALSDTAAGVIGVVALLVMITAAVALFVSTGMQLSKWEYIKKEAFETEYGVEGMVKERRKAAKPSFVRSVVTGVAMCILSPVPLIVSALSEAELLQVHMVSLLLAIVGLAVVLFIRAGMPWEAMEQLLQEGDYTLAKKHSAPIRDTISSVYWMIVLAAFLVWSFMSGDWGITWVVWPVAGILFAAVMSIVEALHKGSKK